MIINRHQNLRKYKILSPTGRLERLVYTTLVLALLIPANSVLSQAFIVKEGMGEAGIVVAEDPPRMVGMAALELQYYLEKISGARLPVISGAGGSQPVKIYVGRSGGTDSLGISDEGLDYGAFRIVSGPDWLVLLGKDFDYNPEPVEPWARSHSDRPRAQEEWEKLTMQLAGKKWGHPFNSIYKAWWNPKNYDDFMSGRYGPDNRNIWNPRNLEFSREYQGDGMGAGFWYTDEGGSLNAVYEFLRKLGLRWYMPGKMGEVIPLQETIALSSHDETVHPDFAVRSYQWYNHYNFSFEDIIWARRIGINSGSEVLGRSGGGYTRYCHGLNMVKSSAEMKQAHPEYYALIDGVRDTSHREAGRSCFTSGGLIQETVEFVRFLYDQYDQPHVSIWPEDGFKQCQCDSCLGKSPSDLVWGFVDRVARELYQSHPDRLVSCGAYTPYIYPPGTVARFTPNVVVFIANAGRPGLSDPGRWESYWGNVSGWHEKLAAGNIMRVENNRYSIKWGEYDDPMEFPVIHPRALAKDMRALKGLSRGEVSEESQARGQWHAPGIDHLTLYVQARFFWDADQDIDSLLEEYYTLFYGPAHNEMKAAFEYAESNYQCYVDDPVRNRCTIVDPREMDISVKIQLLELLHAARDSAGQTVYGQRIRTIIDELVPLEQLLTQVRDKTTLTVVDRSTGDPVFRAEIQHGETTYATDYSGKVIIDGLEKGKWVFNIGHSAYFPLTDSLMITGDTSLVIHLTRKLAGIQFEVSDSLVVVHGATVSLNGWDKLTDSEGRAWFNNQPARHTYKYTVEADGYRGISDSVFLEIDTTITVILQLATGRDAYTFPEAEVFPNPAAGEMYIRIGSPDARIHLLSPEGKVLLERRLSGEMTGLDISGFEPGLYILRIMTDESTTCRKVVLK
jgi:hypothetical protein